LGNQQGKQQQQRQQAQGHMASSISIDYVLPGRETLVWVDILCMPQPTASGQQAWTQVCAGLSGLLVTSLKQQLVLVHPHFWHSTAAYAEHCSMLLVDIKSLLQSLLACLCVCLQVWDAIRRTEGTLLVLDAHASSLSRLWVVTEVGGSHSVHHSCYIRVPVPSPIQCIHLASTVDQLLFINLLNLPTGRKGTLM
jgi:hypothetical protein